MKRIFNNRGMWLPALASAVTAALASSAGAGTTGNEVTISTSGSTALKAFVTGQGITQLEQGKSITLDSGPGGTPVTYAPDWSSGLQSFQLAPNPLGSGSSTGNNQGVDAVRLEYHESGSVEGILELANDQVGPLPYVENNIDRNPNNGNAVWVNGNQFGGVGGSGGVGSTLNGFNLGPMYGTNADGSIKQAGPGVQPTFDLHGKNVSSLAGSSFTQAGQNAVQLAVSDVVPVQAFQNTTAGTDSHAATPWLRTPTDLNYGTGNSALPSGGLGVSGGAVILQNPTVLNMAAGANNPRTGTTFGAGPWNSAGLGNLDSRRTAVTATLFVANPGTGLDKLNRTDAQWLQTTGRLSNGAAFQMTTRDVNSGTRNVAALNTGVDPTWAVGVNDDGNGNGATGATSQIAIGSGLRFSNKTAGGAQLRPTVQNARMAVGTLSVGDANGKAQVGVTSPIRALLYSDSPDGSSGYVQAGAQTIINGTYAIYQNEQFVTLKAPTAAHAGDSVATWSNLTTGDPAAGTGDVAIQGDNSDHDVAHVRDNVLSAVKDLPVSSVANPAFGLINKGFILPQFMQVEKPMDGIGLSQPNPSYDSTRSGQYLSDPSSTKFVTQAAPDSVTTGAGDIYGGAASTAGFNGTIPITASNYMFGNFNQNGVRDYDSVVIEAQKAQAAMESGTTPAGNSAFTADGGQANSTAVHTGVAGLDAMNSGAGASKGDLIVLGDYNGDGKFDGKDLYLMADGASLADSNTATHLTIGSGQTFGDVVRTGVLRKNAALDYLSANATSAQKQEASASAANDPTGANAFNKFDVNRDGKIDLNDAAIVDKLVGKDYRNLGDQLTATINQDGTVTPVPPQAQKSINLVNVELNDNGTITNVATGPASDGTGTSDFKLIHDYLHSQGTIIDGDANFDGKVDVSDLGILATNYGNLSGQKWSTGDFTFDGGVDVSDLGVLATDYGMGTGMSAAQASLQFQSDLKLVESEDPTFAKEIGAVPEPGSLSLLGVVAIGLVGRRRRKAE